MNTLADFIYAYKAFSTIQYKYFTSTRLHPIPRVTPDTHCNHC